MAGGDQERPGQSEVRDGAADVAAVDAAALSDGDLTEKLCGLERQLTESPAAESPAQVRDQILLQRSIGELRWERYRRARDPADVEAAQVALNGAMEAFAAVGWSSADDPEMFAALCYDIAVILRLQAVALPTGDALAQAITLFQAAADTAPDADRIVRYRRELASALLDSAEQTGDGQQYDRAADVFRLLVPADTDLVADPDARASARCDLATPLVRKWLRATAADDRVRQVLAEDALDQAIDVLGTAAATDGLTAPLLARTAFAYAFAVSLRCGRERELRPKLTPQAGRQLPVVTSGQLARAEELLRSVVEHGEPAGDSAQLLVNLLLQDWTLCARPEVLTQAEAVARAAVAATTAAGQAGDTGGEAAAGAQLALGRVLAARPMDASGPDLAGPITVAFRTACDGYQQLDPSRLIAAGRQWASWAITLARWPDAVEAFGRVEDGVRAKAKTTSRQEDRLVHLRTMTGVATDAAFARALAGNPAGAIEELEHDRNMFYATMLAGRDRPKATQADAAAAVLHAGLAQAAGLRLEVAELTARLPDTALVFLVPTSVGGIALITAPGETVHAELLPELTAEAAELNIGKFWGALTALQWRSTNTVTLVVGAGGIEDLTPQAQLDALTGWLWTAAMRRVIQLTSRWPRIALIPTGKLVSAPLHAAWRPDAAALTGRRYAIDDAQIIYLPTVGLLRPELPGPLTDTARLLVVQEPRPCSEPDLPGAAGEASAVARSFPDVTPLVREEATRERVLAALSGHDIAHLICHGRSDPVNPLDSHLVLSNDEHLSVADLIDRDLSALRLVVLSACESASPSTHLPEAAISLPGALLAIGAGGVIGSLWAVADANTSMLMARLYQGLCASGNGTPTEPAEALRAAQQWTRDTTNAQKAEAFPDLVDTAADLGGPRLAALWAQARTPLLHWGAFIHAGR